MIGSLPTVLEVGGKFYAIRSDFREILNIFQAFNDPELTEQEKAYVCVKCLYIDYENIPHKHMNEAIKKAYWFCDGGNMPKSKPEQIKSFDWEQDESILFPAVNKVAGCEVRNCEYMHWWTFIGYFGEIGEGLFSTIMHIRQKKLKRKKLDKGEEEFYKQNKDLINLYTAQDKAEIAETEEFIKELLGE